jgi:CDGSH-type Zn-finger protein
VSGWAVVRHCPDGPILVRGAETVQDEEGNEIPVTRPVVALCACGKSSRKPWCDATHKAIQKP